MTFTPFELPSRSTREVLDDHLELARRGAIEEDLERNYSRDVVFLIADGIYRGHVGARELASRLAEELPMARFDYIAVLTDGEVGFLEWAAEAESAIVTDGADSYVIRGGKIMAQTIHYSLIPR
jgi:hypothetical protein